MFSVGTGSSHSGTLSKRLSFHFIIRMNHQALRRILALKESAEKLAIWRLRLMKFDFEVVRRPVKRHKAADAMFTLPQKALKRKARSTGVDDDILT